jgi:hypothetical protein
MSDYGDACATMRTVVRDALVKSSNVSGVVHGPRAEAIVEAMIGNLHDRSIAWALREIIDRPTPRALKRP